MPYPPSINNYYKQVRGGGVRIGTEGKAYREKIIDVIQQALPKTEVLDEKLSVWIEAYMPDKRIRDLDNIQKALLDAITHAGRVWNDDFHIDDLRTVRAGLIPKGSFVRVHIRRIIKPETQATKPKRRKSPSSSRK